MRTIRATVLLLALAFSPVHAAAHTLQDRGPPQHRVVHRNTLALRHNPIGVLYDGRVAYRYRLYESDALALRDNFLGVGVAPTASPAFAKAGPYVEFSPLTVLGFWAAYQRVWYFGGFNHLQSFASPGATFSDELLEERAADGYPSAGWELTLGANLQARFGPIIVRDLARAVNGDFALREGDRIYYDPFYDAGAPDDGFTIVNDVDLLWQGLEGRFLAGGRYTSTTPLYEPRHFEPGGPRSADNDTHRVGPFLAWTLLADDGARVGALTTFLLVQGWVKHRFRASPMPLVAIGLQATGDLLPLE